ncbi:MAG: twin-arginine translocase TatA/TatE family subunit [Chthonomonadales bacterium]|nr:twin-arginine translocase TatA/TatE family subunit [Chthonomonadales bacterium]
MLDLLAMFESPQQWLIVLVIVLLLFGGNRIPELMKGLGSGMREFKKGLNEEDETPKKPAAKSESDTKE